MLRRVTVIDGDDNSVDFPAESPANSIVSKGIRGEIGKSTSMEENDHRKGGGFGVDVISGGIDGGSGCEETEPNVIFGVNDNVFGGNAVNRDGVRGRFAI